jgi:hypothetical protein
MMVGLAGVLTRNPCIAAMTNGRSFVSALRLRAVPICVRRLRLLEVIGVNLLLSLGEDRERWENSNRQHES